jgi:maltose alpha-D-glucosyltransferase/alpha-amylase
MRKLIAVRQGHRVFGRGSVTFLTPENRRIIAYVREYDGQTVLCVANLSRVPQQATLDLAEYRGRVPVEMIGWSPFATITDERYCSRRVPKRRPGRRACPTNCRSS